MSPDVPVPDRHNWIASSFFWAWSIVLPGEDLTTSNGHSPEGLSGSNVWRSTDRSCLAWALVNTNTFISFDIQSTTHPASVISSTESNTSLGRFKKSAWVAGIVNGFVRNTAAECRRFQQLCKHRIGCYNPSRHPGDSEQRASTATATSDLDWIETANPVWLLYADTMTSESSVRFSQEADTDMASMRERRSAEALASSFSNFAFSSAR